MIDGKAILWSPEGAYDNDRFDGCTTRRKAILQLLEREEQWQILHLTSRGGLYDGSANLLRLLYFLRAEEGLKKVLLFYPDFPLFHPPRQLKLPLLRTVLQGIRILLRKTKAKLFVDVVDLPRWQARDLGYTLRMAEQFLRAAEKEIFDLADCVVLPSKSLAQLAIEDEVVEEKKIKILPNGLARKASVDLPARARGNPSFFYAGSLSLGHNRRILQLVQSFMEKAKDDSVLHLCGEGGQWLAQGDYPTKIVYHGHLKEQECLELAEKCDFGLIPYPEGDYFNWCFPSKLGLYLSAGVAILSTDLKETKGVITKLEVGETKPAKEFSQFFTEGQDLLARYDRRVIRQRAAKWDWAAKARQVFEMDMPLL